MRTFAFDNNNISQQISLGKLKILHSGIYCTLRPRLLHKGRDFYVEARGEVG